MHAYMYVLGVTLGTIKAHPNASHSQPTPPNLNSHDPLNPQIRPRWPCDPSVEPLGVGKGHWI